MLPNIVVLLVVVEYSNVCLLDWLFHFYLCLPIVVLYLAVHNSGCSVNRKTEKPNRKVKNRTEPKPKFYEFSKTEPNRKPKLKTAVNRKTD